MRKLGSIYLAVLFLALGCSKDGDPGKGGSVPGQKAKSPEEALSWLNSHDRQSLETWKGQLLKSCDAKTIFEPGGSEDASLVDVEAFLKQTGGSLALKNAAGELALLDSPVPEAGEEISTYDTSQSHDGQTTALSAATARNGTTCAVSLFGQKVHEAQVASYFPVFGHFNPAKPATTVDIPRGTAWARQGEQEISTQAFLAPVRAALAAGDDVFGFLAARSGLSEPQARRFFRTEQAALGSQSGSQGTILPIGWEVAPFSVTYPELMGSEAALSPLTSPGIHPQGFEWRLRPSPTTVAREETRSAWVLRAQIRFEGSVTGGGKASLQAVTLEASQPYSDDRAAACFSRRLGLAKIFKQTPLGQWNEPSFDAIASPCAGLTADVHRTILRQSGALGDFLSVFTEITPSPQAIYGDWGGALTDLAVVVQDDGKDIAGTLDPQGRLPLIRQASDDARYFHEGLDTSLRQALGEEMTRVAFSWALKGAHADNRADILAAVKRAGPAFSDSVGRLLAGLNGDPHGQAEAVRFAIGLSDDYLALWAGTLAKSEGLHVSYVRNAAGTALQDRPVAAIVQGWSQTLDAAKVFSDGDEPRQPGAMHDEKMRTLLNQAVGEGWDTASFQTLSQLMGLAALRIGCENYKDHASLASCVGFDRFSRKAGALLDPKYGGRYGRFAATEQDLLGQLDRMQSSTKYELQNEIWSPLWGRCDNPAFDQKGTQLKGEVSALASTDDFQRKFEIENQIRDTLRDCR